MKKKQTLGSFTKFKIKKSTFILGGNPYPIDPGFPIEDDDPDRKNLTKPGSSGVSIRPIR